VFFVPVVFFLDVEEVLDCVISRSGSTSKAVKQVVNKAYALGVPEKVIQQILRHANVSTTSTYYIKTVPAQVADAMEKLQQALPESLSGNEVATDAWKAAAPSVVN
jgi:hypothetical protein